MSAAKAAEVGYFFLRDRVELCLGVLPARQEAVVPDVERLERPVETCLDQLRDAWHKRRAQDLLEHGLDTCLRQLTVEVETSRDQARRRWRVRILEPRSAVGCEQLRVARVGFALIGDPGAGGDRTIRVLHSGRRHFVRVRAPVDMRVVHDDRGDGLVDDPSHYLLDHALAWQAVLSAYCALSSSRRFQCVISRFPAGNNRRPSASSR